VVDVIDVRPVCVADLRTGDLVTCARSGVVVGAVESVRAGVITFALEYPAGRRWRMDYAREGRVMLDLSRPTLPCPSALRDLVGDGLGPGTRIGAVLELARPAAA